MNYEYNKLYLKKKKVFIQIWKICICRFGISLNGALGRLRPPESPCPHAGSGCTVTENIFLTPHPNAVVTK